ncbi:MAG: chemotaxis protein CheB [Pirellulaceae bacterium]
MAKKKVIKKSATGKSQPLESGSSPSTERSVKQSSNESETRTKESSKLKDEFPIVGIGASAGGLEALEELLEAMPEDTGMAFVVVTHQHPGHSSLLPQLLSKVTGMPVTTAGDGAKVEPNHVYIGPPGAHLAILNRALHLMAPDESYEEHLGDESSHEERHGGHLSKNAVTDEVPPVPSHVLPQDGVPQDVQRYAPRLPIDYFFRSLADDVTEQSICIVLSGTGTDGTLGLRAIKGVSGMAMVQEPTSAKYSGMLASALNTGLADYVPSPS